MQTRIPLPRRFAFLIAALGAAACGDLFVDPAAPEASGLAVSFSVTGSAAGGGAEAFDRADRVRIRLLQSNGTAVLDTVVPLSPPGATREASLTLDLQQDQGTFIVEAQLLFEGQTLFSGSSGVTLRQNQTTSADVALAPVIARIEMPAFPDITAIGDRATLTGAAVFATGDTVRGVTVTFSTPDVNILSLSANGEAIARAEGEARIIATAGGVTTTSRVTVRAIVAQVRTTLSNITLDVGEQANVQFTALDSNGNALQRTGVWESSAPLIASVDNTGRVTAHRAGAADITVTVGTQSATVRVTVLDDPIIAVIVEPAVESILVGQQTIFRATALRQSGQVITNPAVTWTSSNVLVAVISAMGTATGIAPGATMITATVEGVSGFAALSVTSAQVVNPVISNFTMLLSQINDPTCIPGATPAFNRYTFSMDYSDPDGNVTTGSMITGTWTFNPGGFQGPIQIDLAGVNPTAGTLATDYCFRFGSTQSVTVAIELVNALGAVSNTLSATALRPMGANEPPPGSITAQGTTGGAAARPAKTGTDPGR